jgi:hypothetical protein
VFSVRNTVSVSSQTPLYRKSPVPAATSAAVPAEPSPELLGSGLRLQNLSP